MIRPAQLPLAPLALLLATLYAVLLLSLENLPFSDLPNHAARALIIADEIFAGGARFGGLYDFRAEFQPYILGDLLLASAVHLLSPVTGATFFMLACLLVPVFALSYYARALGAGPKAVAMIFIVALVLCTDRTFTAAFTNYRLGLGLAFLALAFAEKYRRTTSAASLVAYVALLLAGHLVHLASTLVVSVAAGSLFAYCWLFSRQHRARALTLFCIPVALFALQLLAGGEGGQGEFRWAGPTEKITTAIGLFDRYPLDQPWNRLLALALLLGLSWAAWASRFWRAGQAAAIAACAAGASFLAYLVLPTYQGEVNIDLRLLPPALMFGAVAVLVGYDGALARRPSRNGVSAVLIVLLSTANLAHLWRDAKIEDAAFGAVRRALSALPRRARILPISSQYVFGHYRMHASCFAVIDRDALTPYLFSGDQGHPQEYFRYVDRPRAPDEYIGSREEPIDWTKITADWPYVLVIGPAKPRVIPPNAAGVAFAREAALLRVGVADRRERIARLGTHGRARARSELRSSG